MEKLSKESVSLFTVIACIAMLVAFFFLPAISFFGGSATPLKLMTDGAGWLGVIVLVIDMLVPFYLCLYAYRDQKALEPLKPIFAISPKLAYSLPLIALAVSLLVVFLGSESWAIILFAIAACCAYYIGQSAE